MILKLIHRLSLLFSLLLLLLPCLLSAEVTDYEQLVIEKIEVLFVNEPDTTSYRPQKVLDILRTTKGDRFNQTDFDSDLKSLAEQYDHVEPEVNVFNDKMEIKLKIWPKPIIGTICFEGNLKVKDWKLLEELGCKEKQLFDRVSFNEAFHKLKIYYIKQGYFEATLDYTVQLDDSCNEVHIVVCINEGRSGRIQKIEFCGFSRCEEDEIYAMMYTKPYNFFLSWYTQEGTYNEEAIQQDQFRILNYLHNLGYSDASVDIDVIEGCSCDRIIIRITATKGECYSFGPITFCGNCIYDDECIQRCFKAIEGNCFSPEAMRETVNTITDLYGRHGYIDAIVDYEPVLMDDKNAYSVRFTIEEGEQYHVGLIKVFGNQNTLPQVILHECLLYPGEVFNLDKLSKSEERLENIGYFKCVNVYPASENQILSACGCRYRDVHIEVEECGTGHFGAFFGFSTADSVFGGLTLTEKNFDHCGLLRMFNHGICALRGGGEYVNVGVNVGKKSTSYAFSWTKPYFMDTQWSIGFDIERILSQEVSKDYRNKIWGFALHASYPIDQWTRFAWHYRLRNSTVTTGHNASAQLRQEAKNGGLISAMGVSLAYDSTNSVNCPTDGFRSRLEIEYAGLGGDDHFGSAAYLNTLYHPVTCKGTLKLRADVRYVIPVGSTSYPLLPLDERLYLGGDDQLRGYRPYSIGPKFANSTEPSGGISLGMFSTEYNYKIFEKLDAFVFFDSGYLTDKVFDFGNLYMSYGAGIRFQVFEAGPPVTIGYGIPINAQSRSDEKKFFWALGGRF